jgi:hypothetical protein
MKQVGIDILQDIQTAMRPYWSILILLGIVYLADMLFHRSIKDLMRGIIEELAGLLKTRASPMSLNALGGVFIFIIVLGNSTTELFDRIFGPLQKTPEMLEMPISVVVVASCFVLAIYFILSVALTKIPR